MLIEHNKDRAYKHNILAESLTAISVYHHMSFHFLHPRFLYIFTMSPSLEIWGCIYDMGMYRIRGYIRFYKEKRLGIQIMGWSLDTEKKCLEKMGWVVAGH